MKKYLKLFGVRIIIYVLLFICLMALFKNNYFCCSKCYIENSICMSGYGGINIINVLKGYIIPIIIFELTYIIIIKKMQIKAKTLTIIMTIIFVSLNLVLFKFMEYIGIFHNDAGCNYCAVTTNCNEDHTNCYFIDAEGQKHENLNCSYYFN